MEVLFKEIPDYIINPNPTFLKIARVSLSAGAIYCFYRARKEFYEACYV